MSIEPIVGKWDLDSPHHLDCVEFSGTQLIVKLYSDVSEQKSKFVFNDCLAFSVSEEARNLQRIMSGKYNTGGVLYKESGENYHKFSLLMDVDGNYPDIVDCVSIILKNNIIDVIYYDNFNFIVV